MEKLPQFDDELSKQRQEAEAAGEVSSASQQNSCEKPNAPPRKELISDCVVLCCVCFQVLRYVGVVDAVQKKGTVELKRYKKDHPFAQLSGADNIIAFTTKRYKEQPLIVRGPGAGAQVTAGGIFSDILRLAFYLGAPS